MSKEVQEGSTKYFECPSMFETNDIEKFCYISLQQGKSEGYFPITLTDSQYNRSIAVGKALGDLQKYNTIEGFSVYEAITLGNLHDIGYCFTASVSEHARMGGEFLRSKGYSYWQEVYWHGCQSTPYDSPILTMLDVVDITTCAGGVFRPLGQAATEIASRYGSISQQFSQIETVISGLKDRMVKFNLTIPDSFFS